MLNTLLLIGGLALILAGANGLTDGSAAVAKRFRISDLVIGLTIVAFGTSAPELVISVLSALNGSAEMAIGNVVGSNIFNALMIIGCTALVLPIKVGEGTMSKEIPLVILSSLVLFVCANDMMLDREAVNVISRSDGFVLLAFFLIFTRYTFAIARNGADEAGEEQKIKEMPVWKSVLYIAGGLAGLIFGGQLFVDGASGLARSWGRPYPMSKPSHFRPTSLYTSALSPTTHTTSPSTKGSCGSGACRVSPPRSTPAIRQ